MRVEGPGKAGGGNRVVALDLGSGRRLVALDLGSGIWENLIVLFWEQPSLWENLGAGVVGEQVWENLVFASSKCGRNTC